MTAVLVWVLMTWVNEKGGSVHYSPPVTTQVDCERMQDSLPKSPSYIRSRCIQVRVVVSGR